jgi:hypothetical protein
MSRHDRAADGLDAVGRALFGNSARFHLCQWISRHESSVFIQQDASFDLRIPPSAVNRELLRLVDARLLVRLQRDGRRAPYQRIEPEFWAGFAIFADLLEGVASATQPELPDS